jgi:mRNA interferase MazF
MKRNYLRGDIYYAKLGRGIGSEQKGCRPVLIVQNDVGNQCSPTVIVASITSKAGVKSKLPTHYFIKTESGLEDPSVILLEQLRTIDKKRLDKYIGHLDNKHIDKIDKALALSVGL